MKKNIIAITILFVMLISITGFATGSNNSVSADTTTDQTETSIRSEDCVLTPDGREVPWPEGYHEVSVQEETPAVNVQEDEKSLEIKATAEEGIWTKYGFTKSEFDTFPEALKNAMLNEPEEIGKSFNVPTREELAVWNAKEKAVQLVTGESQTKTSALASTEVRNAVGEFI